MLPTELPHLPSLLYDVNSKWSQSITWKKCTKLKLLIFINITVEENFNLTSANFLLDSAGVGHKLILEDYLCAVVVEAAHLEATHLKKLKHYAI